MINLFFQNPFEFLIIAGLLVAALCIHEFSHAFVADHLGDPTPRLAGRLTLNPLAHLDPIGTFLLFFVGFGWGKPVPIDPFNLRDVKRDSALISFAGPASNLLMAVGSSALLRLANYIPIISFNAFIFEIISLFIYWNIILAIFNLIPVYPLDGFAVVGGFLPKKYYYDWMELRHYGVFFLILLIFPFFGASPVSTLIFPIVNLLLSVLLPGKIGGII